VAYFLYSRKGFRKMILNFVGDVCFQDINFNEFYIDSRINNLLKVADYNICNLESPITVIEKEIKNQPIYKRSEPILNPIFESFNVFSLANNHILDFDESGLFDTIEFLKTNKKLYFGAGRNENEALNPLKIYFRDQKIAFIGFTRWQNAKSNAPGTAPDNLNKLKIRIKTLKNDGFFIIAYPHWNYINSYHPSPTSRKFAKILVNCGVDLIIGAHSHVIQGYEKYFNKFIYYSLGNFIFDYDFNRLKKYCDKIKVSDTFILNVNIDEKYQYKTKIIPIRYSNEGIYMIDGKEKIRFFSGLEEISNCFKNRDYYKYFYAQSTNIINFTHDVFKKGKNNYLTSFFSRIHRGRFEDLKIFLIFILQKIFKKKVLIHR
jgi:hypothetical protein